MPLYLGFDCSTQSLSAIVVEVTDDDRRIVFEHSLNFDRDLPEYGTTNGDRQGDATGGGVCAAADVGRRAGSGDGLLASAAEVDVENIRAISGAAQQHGSVYLNHRAPRRGGRWRIIGRWPRSSARHFARDCRQPGWTRARPGRARRLKRR